MSTKEVIEKEAASPPGWGGTVRAMKKHKEIDNPYALAWYMSKKKKGDKWGPGGKLKKKPHPHYKEDRKKSNINDEQIILDVIKTFQK